MRRDGKYTLYRVQHDYHKKGSWTFSDTTEIFYGEKTRAELKAVPASIIELLKYYAHGVWQETGMSHASTSEDVATDVMRAISKVEPEHNYRVVCIVIEQTTTVIETMSREVL